MDTKEHNTMHSAMHRDHMDAHQEHTQWLDNLRRWRLERRTIMARLEAMMKTFGAESDRQAEVIEAHERHIERHEKAIIEHDLGGSGLEHDWLATQHESLRKHHTAIQEEHMAVESRHDVMLSRLKGALVEVEAPV